MIKMIGFDNAIIVFEMITDFILKSINLNMEGKCKDFFCYAYLWTSLIILEKIMMKRNVPINNLVIVNAPWL